MIRAICASSEHQLSIQNLLERTVNINITQFVLVKTRQYEIYSDKAIFTENKLFFFQSRP